MNLISHKTFAKTQKCLELCSNVEKNKSDIVSSEDKKYRIPLVSYAIPDSYIAVQSRPILIEPLKKILNSEVNTHPTSNNEPLTTASNSKAYTSLSSVIPDSRAFQGKQLLKFNSKQRLQDSVPSSCYQITTKHFCVPVSSPAKNKRFGDNLISAMASGSLNSTRILDNEIKTAGDYILGIAGDIIKIADASNVVKECHAQNLDQIGTNNFTKYSTEKKDLSKKSHINSDKTLLTNCHVALPVYKDLVNDAKFVSAKDCSPISTDDIKVIDVNTGSLHFIHTNPQQENYSVKVESIDANSKFFKRNIKSVKSNSSFSSYNENLCGKQSETQVDETSTKQKVISSLEETPKIKVNTIVMVIEDQHFGKSDLQKSKAAINLTTSGVLKTRINDLTEKIISQHWCKINEKNVCTYCLKFHQQQSEMLSHVYEKHKDKVFRCLLCNFHSLHAAQLTAHFYSHAKSSLRDVLISTSIFKALVQLICEFCFCRFSSEMAVSKHRKNVHRSSDFICTQCDHGNSRKACQPITLQQKHHQKSGKTREGLDLNVDQKPQTVPKLSDDPEECRDKTFDSSVPLHKSIFIGTEKKFTHCFKLKHSASLPTESITPKHLPTSPKLVSYKNEKGDGLDPAQKSEILEIKKPSKINALSRVSDLRKQRSASADQFNRIFCVGDSTCCVFCLKDCGEKRAVKYHALAEHADRILTCSHCPYRTVDTARLEKHQKLVHRRRRCRHCDAEFTVRQVLFKHLVDVHQDYTRAKICHVCGLSFSCSSNLLKHFYSKHRDPKFLCSEPSCTRKFITKSMLDRHLALDHLNTRVKCPYCPVSFVSNSAFVGHLRRVHGGEKRYKCEWAGCDKRFADKYTLGIHQRRHTDEKPMCCCLCEYRCRQRASLTWHYRKQHSEYPEQEIRTMEKSLKTFV